MYIFYPNVTCPPGRHIPQILRIMKLTAILLFVTIMQVSAVTYAQKITLNQSKVTIKQIFKEIKKQTGYDVFYLPEMLDASQSINANFKDTPVEQVISKVIEGHPLTFIIDEKTIVIKKKKTSVPQHRNQLQTHRPLKSPG